jgi:hypothetical protein
MNLIELKSHAYDVIVRIEALQNELRATNQAIAEYKIEKNKKNDTNGK